jgi:hypothetical protein
VNEEEHAARLEERRQLLLWRHRQLEQVIRELLANRCTLLAAAARFRALYQPDPVIEQALRDTYPAPTEDERLCRWVIAYFRTDQRDEPGTPEVAERLERELREHLERGTLQLPEPQLRPHPPDADTGRAAGADPCHRPAAALP